MDCSTAFRAVARIKYGRDNARIEIDDCFEGPRMCEKIRDALHRESLQKAWNMVRSSVVAGTSRLRRVLAREGVVKPVSRDMHVLTLEKSQTNTVSTDMEEVFRGYSAE